MPSKPSRGGLRSCLPACKYVFLFNPEFQRHLGLGPGGSRVLPLGGAQTGLLQQGGAHSRLARIPKCTYCTLIPRTILLMLKGREGKRRPRKARDDRRSDVLQRPVLASGCLLFKRMLLACRRRSQELRASSLLANWTELGTGTLCKTRQQPPKPKPHEVTSTTQPRSKGCWAVGDGRPGKGYVNRGRFRVHLAVCYCKVYMRIIALDKRLLAYLTNTHIVAHTATSYQ